MRRRDVVKGLVVASVARPLPLRAQQQQMPVVAYLSHMSQAELQHLPAAFRNGLGELGFVEGRNVSIEYHAADGKAEMLAELVASFVRRRVAVIFATPTPPALAAKHATRTIPIVFAIGVDPVEIGLVSHINRPGGNVTGHYYQLTELVAKRFALLHELLPKAKRFAVLVDRATPLSAEPTARAAATAARALGLDIQFFEVSSSAEINQAFVAIAGTKADALFVGPQALFSAQRTQIASLASQHLLPASYHSRDIVQAGGLMSYGPNFADIFRQSGAYAARILKGAMPADLPVVQPTRFDLIINLKTAKALGIEVPHMLLARADEAIE